MPPKPIFLETGAGNTTITLLYCRPSRLITIAPDAELYYRMRGFCEEQGIDLGLLEFHVEGSQWILPQLALDNRRREPYLDFALIDASHGWPTAFVDLELPSSIYRRDTAALQISWRAR